MPLATPVALLVFNRPELTSISFERIRVQGPLELFIIADGPRYGHPADDERCRRVREIVEQIDWRCTVRRNYAEVNMGLKARVSSGLHWVFSQVDRAIVLEDDCVPDDEFFPFCEVLLERYQDDERVAAVTGNNFQGGQQRGDGSYYFSKFAHCWGWATWSRAWRWYEGDIAFWPEWKRSSDWRQVHPDPIERRYWEGVLDRVARGEIDSWAYPWMASTWYRSGLTATPNSNLVRNIGFGSGATHTKRANSAPRTDTAKLGKLSHPSEVRQDAEADRFTFDHHFGGAALRDVRGRWGSLRRVAAQALRRATSALRASDEG